MRDSSAAGDNKNEEALTVIVTFLFWKQERFEHPFMETEETKRRESKTK